MAIRANQHVPRVVWEQVQKSVGVHPAVNDQRLFIWLVSGEAERAFVLRRLLTMLNVDHAVWSPEVLKGVWNARQFARELHPRFGHG